MTTIARSVSGDSEVRQTKINIEIPSAHALMRSRAAARGAVLFPMRRSVSRWESASTFRPHDMPALTHAVEMLQQHREPAVPIRGHWSVTEPITPDLR